MISIRYRLPSLTQPMTSCLLRLHIYSLLRSIMPKHLDADLLIEQVGQCLLSASHGSETLFIWKRGPDGVELPNLLVPGQVGKVMNLFRAVNQGNPLIASFPKTPRRVEISNVDDRSVRCGGPRTDLPS